MGGRDKIRKNIQALLDKTEILRKNTENTKQSISNQQSVNTDRQGFFPLAPRPVFVPAQVPPLPPALVIPTVVGMATIPYFA